jgi:hypothetical protein
MGAAFDTCGGAQEKDLRVDDLSAAAGERRRLDYLRRA